MRRVSRRSGRFASPRDSSRPIVGEQQISFAEWLDGGIEHAEEARGTSWRDGFAQSGPLAFLFHPPAKVLARTRAPSSSVLLGVVSPSADSLGRPFPFSVLTEVRDAAYGAGGVALPVAAERFIADAADVCALATTVSSPSVLLEEAERQIPPQLEECAQAAEDLRAWTREEGSLAKLWPLLFPRDGVAGASRALRAVVDSVLPMRAHGRIATGRSIRLPLGYGGAAAATFWIDIVRVLAGWSDSFPAAFWPADRAAGELVVCLGDASAPLFAQLWAGHSADSRVVDVGAALEAGRARGLAPRGKARDERDGRGRRGARREGGGAARRGGGRCRGGS